MTLKSSMSKLVTTFFTTASITVFKQNEEVESAINKTLYL